MASYAARGLSFDGQKLNLIRADDYTDCGFLFDLDRTIIGIGPPKRRDTCQKLIWLGADENIYEARVVVRHQEARCAKDVRADQWARILFREADNGKHGSMRWSGSM